MEARGALAGTNENTCDVGMLTVTDTGEVGGMGGAGEGAPDTGVVDVGVDAATVAAVAVAAAAAAAGACTTAGVGGASSAGGAKSGLGGLLHSSPPSDVSSSPPFASPHPCA